MTFKRPTADDIMQTRLAAARQLSTLGPGPAAEINGFAWSQSYRQDVTALLARLSAAEREAQEAWRALSAADTACRAAEARAEALEAALRGLMAALAVDAEGNLTGDFGQWSDAWLVAGAALAGREGPGGG